MSFNAALQAVESHLAANWTATPIAYENVDFTPPTGNWIKVMLITEKSELLGLGATRLRRHTGRILLYCFVPVGDGAQAAMTLADSAIAVFDGANLAGFTLRTPRAVSDEDDDTQASHFRALAVIPFWRDETV